MVGVIYFLTMERRTKMKDPVYQIITERIISLLEKGTVPWHKPWQGDSQMPKNLVSRRYYQGINLFLLHAMGYHSPFWLTFNQVIRLGGHVRKGEHACPVVFWKWLDGEEDKQGEAKRIPFLRYYSVFNVEQCEGLEFQVPEPEQPSRPCNPIEAAQRIVNDMPKRPLIKLGQTHAFYAPREDMVGMPWAEKFISDEEYYSTLFHELTHSTGHSSRLNRKGITERTGFGTQNYSKEELVAEMGAAFLCGQAIIVHRTIDNSTAYIQGWLKRLKDDVRLVVQAGAQAQKATDFILGKKEEVESCQT
jgi:antirestriction protein ArdC